MQSNNAVNAPQQQISLDHQVMYLKGLPKSMQVYLKEEAIADWSPRTMYGLYRKHGSETLDMLKAAEALKTQETYGFEHPQSFVNNGHLRR